MGNELQTHEFKVFEAGDYGERGIFTEADLDDMVNLYDPQNVHNAPVVLGHPKTDSPAFGWADSLRRVGKDLWAKAKMLPEMVDWIKRGLYGTRSIAVYRDPEGPGKGKAYLRHIGFLGATPPVIKGMPPVPIEMGGDNGKFVELEFADTEATKLNNDKLMEIAAVLRNLREWLIEQFDIATADKVVGKWTLDMLQRVVSESDAYPAFADKIQQEVKKTMSEITFSEAQHKAILDAELTKKEGALRTEFSEALTKKDTEITTLKAQVEGLTAKVAEFSEKGLKAEVDNFVDTLVREGKLEPARKEKVSGSLLKLAKADPALFAEQKEIYAAGARVVTFGEQQGAEGDVTGKPVPKSYLLGEGKVAAN